MEYTFTKPVWGKQPLIVLTFDDFKPTDYTTAFPELTKRGMIGTSYLNTKVKLDGETFGMTSEGWNQVHEMKDAGWDFQCHTHTHPHLPELTELDIHHEMQQVDEAFLTNGLNTPKHHAYPYGESNNTVNAVIAQYRSSQRNTGMYSSDINTYDSLYYHDLLALSGDVQTQERLDELKFYINTALRDGEIMVIYCHEIVDTPTTAYQVSYNYFIDLVDHIKLTGIKTVTVSDLFSMTNNLR